MVLAVIAVGCSDIRIGDVFGFRPGYIQTAGYSVKNLAIEYSVHGAGERTIFILGGIHGDEQASVVLAKKLQEFIVNEQPGFLNETRVVIMANANPDGAKAGTRDNANGVDLNRNFPTGNRINSAEFGQSGFSEPESAAIAKIIYEYEPDLIISVHQPLACIDYDGDAEEVAELMAGESGLPVKKLGAMPGSLGSYSSQMLSIPIITFELPQGAETLEPLVLWELYKPAIVAAIEYK
jgi:protein MpaA